MKTFLAGIIMMSLMLFVGCNKDDAGTNAPTTAGILSTDWVNVIAGPYAYGPGGTFQLTPDTGYANHPVVYVTWAGAWTFAKHYKLRLPTEQEWEKVARGSTGDDFPWGNSLATGDANYLQSGDAFTDGTTPVGYYNGSLYGNFQTANRPGPYGAYDMAGNAFEWTESFFGGSYPIDRVLRGGSWSNDPSNMRSWSRFNNAFYTQDGGNNIGFRCVKDM